VIWLNGGLTELQQQIASVELDILFYSAIGMDPKTYFLAFARLAPVQCVTWGHPVTTGIPNVDAYLSADSLEPTGAEAHYSEKLIRLGRLPTWYERPNVPEQALGRAGFGLPEDATLYVCPQSLFKLHPDFDDAVTEILRRDPRGLMVLIEGMSKNWGRLLVERLSRLLPDATDRVILLPRMSEDRFFDLVRVADIVLDPFHFGGGNTTYEAFAVGMPIVTWPGQFMRGRVTLGAYRQMGIDGPVATSPDEYVRLAVELANDRDARDRLGAQIRAASHQLFEDDLAIAEIETYLERALERARSTDREPARLGH
jgi:predicted O-linked N-acetylglucosamine transferase (SPINDLY family)